MSSDEYKYALYPQCQARANRRNGKRCLNCVHSGSGGSKYCIHEHSVGGEGPDRKNLRHGFSHYPGATRDNCSPSYRYRHLFPEDKVQRSAKTLATLAAVRASKLKRDSKKEASFNTKKTSPKKRTSPNFEISEEDLRDVSPAKEESWYSDFIRDYPEFGSK